MKLFLNLLLLLTTVSIYAQHRDAYFYQKNDVTHKLFFYEDGQFAEFITTYNADTLLPCTLGTNISYGQYNKSHHGYDLTSSGIIREKNDNLKYELLQCKPLSNDSLLIFLSSPFEDLLLFEHHNLCAYKHPRIYRYCIQIKCDDSENGQIFQKEFNKCYQMIDTNLILCAKPKCVQLKSLYVKIFWERSYNQTYKAQDTVYAYINELEQNTNSLHIRLVSFDYFYLSYEKYCQTHFHFIGKDKAILNGRVFKRYKMSTNDIHLSSKRRMKMYSKASATTTQLQPLNLELCNPLF